MIGPYEASLRERAVAARKRLFSAPAPLQMAAPAVKVEPVAEVAAEPDRVTTKKRNAIIRDIILMSEAPGPFRWRHIVEEVIDKHGISFGQLIGRQRSRPLCAARFEAYYRLSQETTLSLPQIGRALGGKDHTSVLHGIRKYRERNGIQEAA